MRTGLLHATSGCSSTASIMVRKSSGAPRLGSRRAATAKWLISLDDLPLLGARRSTLGSCSLSPSSSHRIMATREEDMVSPYTIDISNERLTVIKARVEAYDWNQLPDTGGWKSGVGIDDLKRLIAYWRNIYDWRKVERDLNQRPNFTADIEGERLHFVHVHGDGSKPPILLLHGWPGSPLEFERLLDPLAADGHDVIVPSLPGFAFSKPITGVIGPRRAAALMHGLIVRLFGPTRYVVRVETGGMASQAGWPTINRTPYSASTSTWSTSLPKTLRRPPPRKRTSSPNGTPSWTGKADTITSRKLVLRPWVCDGR